MPHAVIVDTTNSPHALLRPVPISAVELNDHFWQPRRQINRMQTIPSQYDHCEATGRIDNFRRASGKRPDLPFQGIFFNDSDVYKWLEAACWTLASDDDAQIRRLVDLVVMEIADAQQKNGYLNSYFMFENATERFTNFDKHELYCAGHLFQAAIAHHRVTGETTLLNVATRFADYLDRTFGPAAKGKREYADGHEEIEMALVELARTTGNQRYQKLAQFFIDIRGYQRLNHPTAHFAAAYYQDHQPYREMAEIVGHAVRAIYHTAGATDLLLEADDEQMLAATKRLWENMIERKMYVSGGIGSRYEGEAFGEDYELPNSRAYTETCAAIGSVMWNYRLLLLEGAAHYADLLEWTLYNAVMPGIALDGQSYFYQNPLADSGNHRRQPWFGCACCPPNVARLLAQLPGYFYSSAADRIFVHLYAQNNAHLLLKDGRSIELSVTTEYPWDGLVTITTASAGEYELNLRVPAWAAGATFAINGQAAQAAQPGQYLAIRRIWISGDTVELRLPMPVRQLTSHPFVSENIGQVALARGPLLYCFEAIDHPATDLRAVLVPIDQPFSAARKRELLGGVVTLTAEGPLLDHSAESVAIQAIPYYAWANRAAGQMRVWLRSTSSNSQNG